MVSKHDIDVLDFSDRLDRLQIYEIDFEFFSSRLSIGFINSQDSSEFFKVHFEGISYFKVEKLPHDEGNFIVLDGSMVRGIGPHSLGDKLGIESKRPSVQNEGFIHLQLVGDVTLNVVAESAYRENLE